MAIGYYDANFESNVEALLQGMWYSELPELIDITRIYHNMRNVLEKIGRGDYAYYKVDDNGFIIDFKGIDSPSYLRKPGVEPITYYTFKRNKSLREMQMVNLIHYCAFIYNSLYVFDDIFAKLYLDEENSEYISSSNSYLGVGESFSIDLEYDVEEIDESVFVNGNNKTASWIKMEEGKMRIQKNQKSKIYFIKLDIESFFPNLYTHYLARIGQREPYKSLDVPQYYYDFMDKFHQRINDNQTKGVPAGNFSSHIGAELLMLCVDYDIRKTIGERKIGYVRYVDDMTFYSDDQQELDSMVISVQKILTNYRLRINGNKVEKGKLVKNQGMKISKVEIFEKFKYLNSVDNLELKYEDFFDFKCYIINLLETGRIGQIKTLLTRFLNRMNEEKILFNEIDSWFYYFLSLVFEEETLACHIYKILNKILKMVSNKAELLEELEEKRKFVDIHYSDSLIQIWHYYIMTENMNEMDRLSLFSKYIDAFSFFNANPIIVSHFIIQGNNKNRSVVAYICRGYKEQTGEDDWKSRIMFSKWWLPIFKIKMLDSFNYQNFLGTTLFPDVLKDLAK